MKTENPLPGGENLVFVEQLLAEFARDPGAVSEAWRAFFEQLANGEPGAGPVPRKPSFRTGRSGVRTVAPAVPSEGELEKAKRLQHRVDRLIRAYRVRGHIRAQIDPLSEYRPYVPELEIEHYGFTPADLDQLFVCETMQRTGQLPLREIVGRLEKTYCGSIGAQFMHIDRLEVRHWLQERIENVQYRTQLTRAQQLRILSRLTDAVVFEEFIRKKYVGAKSFSLEGAESLMPLLDLAIEKAGDQGVREIVVGMAHRGRLNVLANIIGKSPREIFREFEDKDPDIYIGGGDVKYHLGYSQDYRTRTGRVLHLSLCFNPSHLEFVNPVALGRVRAKQDQIQDQDRIQVMPLLIHGDAAFIGEGITQETLNLSRLPAYHVGGALHIIVNNQIGFTTQPTQGRSSMYATSVAKMLPAPILHVNGEDPEAVAHCVQLAMDFRQKFKQDVIIDMYCYRRLGHNEGDEPSFTQPLLYRTIRQRLSVRDAYLAHLLKLGEVSQEEADAISRQRQDRLEQDFTEARRNLRTMPPSSLQGIWRGYAGGPEPAQPADDQIPTALPPDQARTVLEKLTQLPEGFNVHPKLERMLDHRKEMARGERPVDWAAAEALALGSLALEGHRIRLNGQDTERGTFSHRHAVLHDVKTDKTFVPLQHLAAKQAPVEISNSPLSELSVLGYEYGYSLDYPDALVAWEAQFGDFGNAAQVIIDQFLVSGEDKWRRLSGLVLLLPHGFEGMGPEHSSARLERFLALAAEDNIQVVVPTTPAQYFHVLRRQVLRKWRKPLVVMTPKSMLRHPSAVSPLAACTEGHFQRVIPDEHGLAPAHAARVLLCSGKLYYELAARRDQLERRDVAILRLEQLYPFPWPQLEPLLSGCRPGTDVIWVQEEPENMGAWRYLRVTVGMQFFGRLPFTGICRPASASPATGSAAAHQIEQEQLLERALVGAEQPGPRPRTETITTVKQLEPVR